ARMPAAAKAPNDATGWTATSATINCGTCHREGACAVAIRSTKARNCGSGQTRAMSSQPRGSGPRCDDRMLRAMNLASSGRAGRIAGSECPISGSSVLQRDTEFGFGLGLDLIEGDAIGELDQRHAVLAVLVDGEDG